MILLSAYQARKIKAFSNSKEIEISLDLGLTTSKLMIEEGFIIFPDSQRLEISHLDKIIKNDSVCYSVEGNELKKLLFFSDETNRVYKLVPTGIGTPPTLEISGIRMHVTKKYSPKEDTEEKISYVFPCTGNVLDTCTGLGYTAIEAVKTADLVYTYEKDSNVIEMQKLNPWSNGLFKNKRIKAHNSDIFAAIKALPNEFFDRIIHDPPRMALATLLYSQGFYNELFRVSKKGSKVYHYTGDPGSKKRGLDIRAGIISRLQRAGFQEVKRVFNGLTAAK